MHIVIAPDKFKGSLTAIELCEVIERGIKRFDPDIVVTQLPLADGGEGTLDLLIPLLGLDTIAVTVHDPLFRSVAAYYGMRGSTAYIEMAKASGLALLAEAERNALLTTSYGTGELIRHALASGAREVYVLIGGSASTDAGMGMAQALGYRFLNANGTSLSPIGQEMINVAAIEVDEHLANLDQVAVRVISDVDNPLYGAAGAAQVYGPQKGATPEAIVQLDQGLMNIADRMEALTGVDVRNKSGAGAAGGFGAGAMAFLHAELLPGIDTIMKLCGADTAIQQADLVISGEGKIDAQTLHGKVVKGVGDVCRKHAVPLGVICGTLAANEEALRQLGIWRAYAVKEETMTLAEAINRTEEQVEAFAYQMVEEFKSIS